MNCEFCGKAIRTYRVWNDWKERASHYRCWKRNERDKLYKMAMDDFIAEQKRKEQSAKDATQEM